MLTNDLCLVSLSKEQQIVEQEGINILALGARDRCHVAFLQISSSRLGQLTNKTLVSNTEISNKVVRTNCTYVVIGENILNLEHVLQVFAVTFALVDVLRDSLHLFECSDQGLVVRVTQRCATRHVFEQQHVPGDTLNGQYDQVHELEVFATRISASILRNKFCVNSLHYLNRMKSRVP
jgi:hypothetical protein